MGHAFGVMFLKSQHVFYRVQKHSATPRLTINRVISVEL